MDRIAANRVFLHNQAINQPASFPQLVQSLGVSGTHSVLDDEWIILVITPLLVERSNASIATIGNDIPNPLGFHRARSGTTFTARY